MGGWIKISRNIQSHWLWSDAERLKWWLDLLFMAAWEEKKVLHDTHLITLQRGQMVASVSFLCRRWKRSNKAVIAYLLMLKSEGMIVRNVMHRQTSIITICNYEKYQVLEEEPLHTIGHTIGHTIAHTIAHTNKEYKNNNKKEITTSSYSQKERSSFCPPDFSRGEEPLKSSFEKEKSCAKKEKAAAVDYDALVGYFNDTTQGAFGTVKLPLGETRRKMLGARIRERGEDAFREVITKALSSDFLRGQNARGWRATFDWLIKPTNYEKVLSGNYENNKYQSGQKRLQQPETIRVSERVAIKNTDIEIL